ncbi:ABC transporter permease [Haploplasma axanthum]|uniref:Transport permease protein n=1 Tax=Haploplasma axanthum TaxID=29552 RepID=A0A449BBX2_HAPAX|nr:ABC transporter permease [Haploplasma axanthum]VEU79936.1 ABC transporter [Haploplasma axanthum]
MYQISNLVKRNIKIFLRDRTAVFFSFLSVIIMLGLYFLFLNNMYSSYLPDVITEKQKNFITTSQMMGGIIVINTLTLSLGMMGNMVNDIYFKKIESFLVTPVKRSRIFISYYLSTMIVTYILSLLMWLFTIVYVVITTGYSYSFLTIISVSLLLLLFTFISTSIMIFMVSFIRSVNAFGTVSGIFGTLIGFVSGIYMPLSILPKAMTYISSVVPFTHMTVLLKQKLLADPLNVVKDVIGDDGVTSFMENFGAKNIGIFNQNVSTTWIMIGIVILSVVLLLITTKRLSRKSK